VMFTEGKNCVIVVKRGGPSPHSSRGAAALLGLGHSKAPLPLLERAQVGVLRRSAGSATQRPATDWVKSLKANPRAGKRTLCFRLELHSLLERA